MIRKTNDLHIYRPVILDKTTLSMEKEVTTCCSLSRETAKCYSRCPSLFRGHSCRTSAKRLQLFKGA